MESAGPTLQIEAKGRHCSLAASFLEWPPAQGRGAGLPEHRLGPREWGEVFYQDTPCVVRVEINQGWGIHQTLLALTLILIRIWNLT